MKILLLGPHGAGRSTQAHLLSEQLHIPYISTGEIFRRLRDQRTPLGEHLHHIMDRGDYVPDDEVISLVEDRLHQPDAQVGFILEGYPRTLKQAQSLSVSLNGVFHFILPHEESVRRQLARQRHDDTLEMIQHRLELHYAEATYVLAYYAERGLLQEVDAHRSIEEIDLDLLARIKALTV